MYVTLERSLLFCSFKFSTFFFYFFTFLIFFFFLRFLRGNCLRGFPTFPELPSFLFWSYYFGSEGAGFSKPIIQSSGYCIQYVTSAIIEFVTCSFIQFWNSLFYNTHSFLSLPTCRPEVDSLSLPRNQVIPTPSPPLLFMQRRSWKGSTNDTCAFYCEIILLYSGRLQNVFFFKTFEFSRCCV